MKNKYRSFSLLMLPLFFLLLGFNNSDSHIYSNNKTSNVKENNTTQFSLKNKETKGLLQNYYRNLRSTVVGITCKLVENGNPVGSYYGTGTVISSSGYILTSTTVVPAINAADIVIHLPQFKHKKAQVVYADEKYELCLVKITEAEDDMVYASFAKSSDVAIGDRVFTAGNAFFAIQHNDEAVFSSGIVSSRYTAYSQQYKDPDPRNPALNVYSGKMIEITAASNGGGDGGGVYDDRGQVIGLLSLNVEKSRNLGLCVPIDTLRETIIAALKDKPQHADFIKTLTIKSSTTSLLKPDPIRKTLQYQATKVFPALARLEIARNNRKKGGDEARNPYLKNNQPNALSQWSIPKGQCTGIYIDSKGLILTSYFNISGDVTSITAINSKGENINCEVVGYDQSKDLALLATHTEVKHWIDFDEEVTLTAGQSVAYIGVACNGKNMSMTMGSISAVGRWMGSAYQTDAKSNIGINGALLIDIDGRPCAMANHMDQKTIWNINSGVSFATNTQHLLPSIIKMKAGKKIVVGKRGFLGVRLSPADSKKGLAITLDPNGTAIKAGLQKGDRIVELEGQAINKVKDLRSILFLKNAGDSVTLKVLRSEEIKKFTVTLQEAAESSSKPSKKTPTKKRKQSKKNQKKNKKLSLPNSHRIYFQPEKKNNKDLEQTLKQIKKDFEKQGYHGEILNKLLKEARKKLNEQHKKKKNTANKLAQTDIDGPLKEAMAQALKDFKAQGFQGDTLDKMLEKTRNHFLEKLPVRPAPTYDRAFLGISLKEIVEGEGVSVTPQAGKAADRAGLKDGDRIIILNDIPIQSPADLIDIIQTAIPGDIVQLKIKRNGYMKTFSFALDGPQGAVTPNEIQLASKYNSNPVKQMLENMLPTINAQLNSLKLSDEQHSTIVKKITDLARKEIKDRMENEK